MRIMLRTIAGMFAVLVLGACDTSGGTAPALETPAGSDAPLPFYGAGSLHRAAGWGPCAAAPHREFDFWVGEWNVFNAAGAQIGTNAVTAELDGCVVAEHWTSSAGTRGRSINAWDAETGQWHQTWVSQSTFGHLRMGGGLVDGVMTLHGERTRPGAFTIFDDYTWTLLDDGRVLQVGIFDLPAFGIHSEFRGFYERTDHLTPAPEARGTECDPGGVSARTRELDFLRGTWSVSLHPWLRLGQSVITADLSDCLIEERFASSRGRYEAVGFLYYDRVEQVFYRTFIDSQGERHELRGDFVDGALVLSGADRLLGRDIHLRVTFEPTGPDAIRQRIEVSHDGGATWRDGLTLALDRVP